MSLILFGIQQLWITGNSKQKSMHVVQILPSCRAHMGPRYSFLPYTPEYAGTRQQGDICGEKIIGNATYRIVPQVQLRNELSRLQYTSSLGQFHNLSRRELYELAISPETMDKQRKSYLGCIHGGGWKHGLKENINDAPKGMKRIQSTFRISFPRCAKGSKRTGY